MPGKKVIGDPIVIGGRQLSLSRAIRAGDFVFLTGQVPFKDGQVMTTGTIEEQTRAVLDGIKQTLAEADCEMSDVVKAMVWLRDRADFPGFDSVYGEYFPHEPPARSGIVSDFLVDIKVEVEVIAYSPEASNMVSVASDGTRYEVSGPEDGLPVALVHVWA